MSETVNLSSLGLVRDQLVVTIEKAASLLEQFADGCDDGDVLQECIDCIKQISGTVQVIQLPGADVLAQELLALASEMTLGESDDSHKRLHVLTEAFFLLPRYLEYTLQTGRALPVLLIPHINLLRQARQAAPLPESYFFAADVTVKRKSSGIGSTVLDQDLPAMVRRFRHMYQVGLLSVLQNKQVKPSLGMMQRALERLASISGDQPMGLLWWVGSHAFDALLSDHMELSKVRKMQMGAIDRMIKTVQQKGQLALAVSPPETLVKELVFWVALWKEPSADAQEVLAHFQTDFLPYNDKELIREREALKGPSANTLSSMAAVLKDELRSTKEVLERAAESGTENISDYDELIDTLTKVSDILAVVGMVTPSNTLKQEIGKIELWRDGKDVGDVKDLLDIADTLLYIESTVSGLDKFNLSDEKLAQINSITRTEAIANSQLQEAEGVVLEEAEAGMAMIKRALSSFAESDYDRGHIKNVVTTLNTVRGGMIVLNRSRAAAVVTACVDFVEDALLRSDNPAALQQLLETFADAVISLEYYLDAIKHDKNASDKVLEVAEESLDALGYAV